MVEKNLKKLQAKKRRVTNGFNTGTRDMRLKTAYRRNSSLLRTYLAILCIMKRSSTDVNKKEGPSARILQGSLYEKVTHAFCYMIGYSRLSSNVYSSPQSTATVYHHLLL